MIVELRTSAIRAFGIMPQPGAAQLLLNRYRTDLTCPIGEWLSKRSPRELSMRESCLGALRSGAIEKSEIPTYAARTLESMLGSDFSEVYGDAAALSGDKECFVREVSEIANARDYDKRGSV